MEPNSHKSTDGCWLENIQSQLGLGDSFSKHWVVQFFYPNASGGLRVYRKGDYSFSDHERQSCYLLIVSGHKVKIIAHGFPAFLPTGAAQRLANLVYYGKGTVEGFSYGDEELLGLCGVELAEMLVEAAQGMRDVEYRECDARQMESGR